ncbi:MAG TPA: hypothetical protein VFC47_13815, partial [Caulobacteraceae bacterium]|nr:hypothetical protein [Caulobacteraceae bacterium]
AAIYGPTSGANAPLTIAGITSAHTLAATISGGANLSYTLNGVVAPYTGAFAVNAGDTLSWTVSKLIRRSGTIAVTDTSNGGAAVDSFDYILTGPS